MNEQQYTWSERDRYFMEQALAQAHIAQEQNEVPVGAIVVHQDTIIGSGHNQPIVRNDPSCHAEVQAIRQAARTLNNYRLPDCTLYVTLEPCIMCCGLLIHARITRLVFATREAKTGAVVSCHTLLDVTRINYQHGLMAKQSSLLLKHFFVQKRATRTPTL